MLDAGAFGRYWDAVVEPLIADAGSLAGRTLKYLHTDSWEVEAVNWTPTLREHFQRRRGYDLLPFLPVLAGRIVDDRSLSHRSFMIFGGHLATWRSTTTTGCSAMTRIATDCKSTPSQADPTRCQSMHNSVLVSTTCR